MGKGTRKRGKRLFVLKEDNDCLSIERRQTWHIGKWWFKKVNGETPC